ncbi:tyrosine-type recombinase/integrase [Microcoleus sp. FACHB-1515]|uniref:site-specific integrase n=1 Tax=Cyanophyceae TaxID=3028117 RepID=UPI001683C0E2|nr:site-specific integrase [Microcoleus sp. FACHB-1515]MBD2091174.1 tyrosine-type recombinase/integrase [Microcoleus sp. FACHB-1515]
MARQRGAKGGIHIENRSGRLVLRWSYQGQRYYLSLNLADTALNRKLAAARSLEIERDIAYGEFDPTLERYGKAPTIARNDEPTNSTPATVIEVWEAYYQSIASTLSKSSQEKYIGTRGRLQQFFGLERQAADLTKNDAIEFVTWYSNQVTARTVKEVCCRIHNAWLHAGLSADVWKDAASRLKPTPTEPPQPFTQTQVSAILTFLKVHHSHYYPFVAFLFLTGVRLGEAIGLRANAISEDLTAIVVRESFSRGQRRPTKTGKIRSIPTNEALRLLLAEQLAKRHEWRLSGNYQIPLADLLVFPANGNSPIDDHNFRNRVWKPTLKALGIPYRKPYSTRSTFVSHALASGMNPVDVAAITGHDPQVMFQHYVGLVAWLKLPDLYQ